MKTLFVVMALGTLIGCSTLVARSEEAKANYPLVSELKIDKKVFGQNDLKAMMLGFRSTNKSELIINLHPIYRSSHLFINGKEEDNWQFIASNGIRSMQFSALPTGKTDGFYISWGERFKTVGHYKVRWESPSFEPVEVEFDVKDN